jgi:hypothetical protein
MLPKIVGNTPKHVDKKMLETLPKNVDEKISAHFRKMLIGNSSKNKKVKAREYSGT